MLIVDLQIIRDNYRKIKKSISGVEVFYAMKANDNFKILEVLKDEGSSFEVSSMNELEVLLNMKIEPHRVMCLNSIKSPEFISFMAENNVEIMAYDSKEEVNKIAKLAPKSKLVLRIAVSNEGSDWPLTKKFGAEASEAIELLKHAKERGLEVIGLTFHVGSQCLNKKNWTSALYICEEIWRDAKALGINFELLSLGGGMPVKHLKPIPSINEIGLTIQKAIDKNFKTKKGKLRITVEPGRSLVGDAAIMVSKVVGKAKRGIEDWLYCDVGVFNGFMETIQDINYEIISERIGDKRPFIIGGPSCDSVDIPFKNIFLPELYVGDYIYIINAGAYTTVYAAAFNGFPIPKFLFLNE
jgi:ornithine decarboxylase